jgi:hypothetical protein
MKQRTWTDDDWAMVARLNAMHVTRKDLWRVAREAEKMHKVSPGEFESMFLVARLFRGQPAKAQAVYFRMEALARLLQERGAPGWTLPKLEDGAIPIQKAVFLAAAVEPLTKVRDDIGFEYKPFLQRVLAEADIEGSG